MTTPAPSCGYTLVDQEGEEYPCDRPAYSWRWYQEVEHEDCLERACEVHENDGGMRLSSAEAMAERLREVINRTVRFAEAEDHALAERQRKAGQPMPALLAQQLVFRAVVEMLGGDQP